MGPLDQLRKLGYTVGEAYGHVQPELDALEAARKLAAAEKIAEDAAPVIAQAQALALEQMRGNPRYTDDDRTKILVRLQVQTLRQLQDRRDADVAHQEAAVEVARGMPDVWAISGPGVTNLYVSTHPETGEGWTESDQELLDALADKKAHRERVAQADAET